MTTFIDPATGYEVLVIRKPIRRIYLRVREGGSVEVTAPRRVSEREIRDFVAGKTAWLTKYMALVPEKIKFQYVTGEIHHVFGRAYPLRSASGCAMMPPSRQTESCGCSFGQNRGSVRRYSRQA